MMAVAKKVVNAFSKKKVGSNRHLIVNYILFIHFNQEQKRFEHGSKLQKYIQIFFEPHLSVTVSHRKAIYSVFLPGIVYLDVLPLGSSY